MSAHSHCCLPDRQGGSGVVVWSSDWMGGWAQGRVRCHPATHMVGDSSLGLGSHHSGRKPERLYCAELFPVTAHARKVLLD